MKNNRNIDSCKIIRKTSMFENSEISLQMKVGHRYFKKKVDSTFVALVEIALNFQERLFPFR